MSGLSDSAFDIAFDEYVERQHEEAAQRAALGDVQARRPDAVRVEATFADLRVGDYMTAEDGPDSRWVKVVAMALEPDATIAVTFEVPQPLGIGMHDRWVITRAPDAAVVIDGAAR